MVEKRDKTERVLGIYTKLMDGFVVNKAQEAKDYGVDERSIQRDIDAIRNFLDNHVDQSGIINSVIYDRIQKGYRLEQNYRLKLNNSEILAICKILLDSRAFTKSEMEDLLGKLVECCVPKSNQQVVSGMIRNEKFHYIEPRHKTVFMDKLWTLAKAIQECRYIEVSYYRTKDKSIVNRRLKPLAIMFSEYYFYLTAFLDDDDKSREHFDVLNDSFPTIYRIDRIKKLTVLEERFHIPYSSRFEEGEFRKRVQFMYGGKLRKIKFRYSGRDVDAILDRLPTARILDEMEDVYIMEAEVFGKGIDMWIRGQIDHIQVVE